MIIRGLRSINFGAKVIENCLEGAYIGVRQISENDPHPDLTECIATNQPVGYPGPSRREAKRLSKL